MRSYIERYFIEKEDVDSLEPGVKEASEQLYKTLKDLDSVIARKSLERMDKKKRLTFNSYFKFRDSFFDATSAYVYALFNYKMRLDDYENSINMRLALVDEKIGASKIAGGSNESAQV